MQYLSNIIDPSWQTILFRALNTMDADYLTSLERDNDYLPRPNQIFSAFQLPLEQTQFILLGESPYPRVQSANGYAFWDAAVNELWSVSGLSKEVNRATSLRNWIKMLLLARGDLQDDLSQQAIALLDKSDYCQTAEEFFTRLINKGFLLLNASLIYSEGRVRHHAKQWRPFMNSLLRQLHEYNPSLQVILFGRIAMELPEAQDFPCLIAEHPYNLSFITNTQVLDFFKPLDLLNRHD